MKYNHIRKHIWTFCITWFWFLFRLEALKLWLRYHQDCRKINCSSAPELWLHIEDRLVIDWYSLILSHIHITLYYNIVLLCQCIEELTFRMLAFHHWPLCGINLETIWTQISSWTRVQNAECFFESKGTCTIHHQSLQWHFRQHRIS